MKTTKFELNIGINSGYYHDNSTVQNSDFWAVWLKAMQIVHAETGIAVAGVILPAITVYPQKYGCPDGGEHTVLVHGLRNPDFITDDSKWRDAVKEVCLLVGKYYDQITAYLSFVEIEFDYIKPNAKGATR